MVESVSNKVTTKTTLTDTDVQDVSNKTSDGKVTTKTTDKPPTVKTTDTGKGEGAPPIREPKLDSSSMMEIIQKLRMKTDELQQKTKAEQIDAAKNKIDQQVKEQVKKIEEAQKKMESQKKWGLFGKIFGGIAVALGVVAAVATGGALAIGVAVLAAAVFTAQETGLMDKMLDGILKAAGVPEKDMAKWKMGINIAITATLMLASFGAAGFSSAANLGTMATKVRGAAMIVGGVAGMGAAATTAGGAIAGYEANMAQVDLKKMQAKMLESQHVMDELIKQLKELMEKLEQGTDITTQVVSAEDDSISKQMQMMKSKA